MTAAYDGDLAEAAFNLATGFDDFEIEIDAGPTQRRALHAAVWMGRIWGHRTGYACLGFGHDGHYPSGGGAYKFTRYEEDWYHWPDERDKALKTAITAAPHVDVYVGVMLRAAKSRKGIAALPGHIAWADVDGEWTPQRQTGLDSLNGATIWQVTSGGAGGRHVYLRLVEPEQPADIERINRRLGALLDADAGWSNTKVLRLPGTYNHKGRALDGVSTPVRWLE